MQFIHPKLQNMAHHAPRTTSQAARPPSGKFAGLGCPGGIGLCDGVRAFFSRSACEWIVATSVSIGSLLDWTRATASVPVTEPLYTGPRSPASIALSDSLIEDDEVEGVSVGAIAV